LIAGALAAAVLSGCGGGLLAVNPQTYLNGIPVRMPDLSAKSGTFRGEYTLVLPAGAIAFYRHCAVTVDVSGAHEITAIRVTDPDDQAEGVSDFRRMESDIIATQSLEVDGIVSEGGGKCVVELR
jgi:uncharacterized protein with FMN-binding domain